MSVRTSLSAALVGVISLAPGAYWGCDNQLGGSASGDDSPPVVAFTSPSDGSVITEPLRYGSVQVQAWDPDAGAMNGSGIDTVDMVVRNRAGQIVATRTEYWATYDFGPQLPDGVYTFEATANADWVSGATSSSTTITVTIAAQNNPAAPAVPVSATAAPTTPATSIPATPVPTPTPIPATSIPATAVPTPTPIPATSVSATAVPTPTPIPATSVSATGVPTPTMIPATSVPATAVPATPIPATPTAVPATAVPATPVPSTPIPATPVPPTPIPATSVPATPVPPTPIPATPVPATPTTVPPTAVPATPVPANSAAEAAAVSLAELNQVRAGVGLPALTLNASMSTFALNWSQTMSQSGFRHSSGPYGENIAWYSDSSLSPAAAARFFNDGWVNSPGHYANMTNSRYTEVGIGLYQDAGGWWATHVFR